MYHHTFSSLGLLKFIIIINIIIIICFQLEILWFCCKNSQFTNETNPPTLKYSTMWKNAEFLLNKKDFLSLFFLLSFSMPIWWDEKQKKNLFFSTLFIVFRRQFFFSSVFQQNEEWENRREVARNPWRFSSFLHSFTKLIFFTSSKKKKKKRQKQKNTQCEKYFSHLLPQFSSFYNMFLCFCYFSSFSLFLSHSTFIPANIKYFKQFSSSVIAKILDEINTCVWGLNLY